VPNLLDQIPDRLTFENVDTDELLEVQYNPVELSEKLDAVYARLAIVGQSHTLMQYSNTSNLVVEFDLAFDAVTRDTGGTYDIMAARRFLMALAYRRRASQAVAGGSPSTVLVLWPNLYTLTCKMTSYGGKFTTFAQNGTPLRWTCHVSLEEVRDMRLWGDDVSTLGTERVPEMAVDPSSVSSNGT
jgi:hypothetical protein